MALDPVISQATDYQLAGASSFEKFLGSDTFLEYRFGPKSGGGWVAEDIAQIVKDEKDERRTPPCLLDLIDVWVVLGDATEVCASFESFLLTIIQIADFWDHWMMGFSRKSVRCALLWPDTLGLDGEDCPGDEIPFGPFGTADGSIDHGVVAANHPVLNRGRWEAIRAARLLNT